MNIRISVAIVCALLLVASVAFGADTSLLKPPPGARVALIEFEDLECPQCAHTSPLLHQAVDTYHIPWVRHDFPLPQHMWSFDAAVIARYFDSKSKKLGDGFRDYCFKNQIEITAQNLRQYAEQYAGSNKIELPFVIDPLGKFAAQVKADAALGERIGIHQTPTVYVVSSGPTPFVEVTDNSQLFAIIDQMKQEAGAQAAPASTRKTAGRHTRRTAANR